MFEESIKEFARFLEGMDPEQRKKALHALENETSFCWDCGYDGCSGVCQNDE